jgi:hypothetical protein
MILKKWRTLLCPLFLVFVAGCPSSGNPNAPVKLTGEITYKNQKVGVGTITFYTDTGVYPFPIQPDGTYNATDLPKGEVLVAIETESANSGQASVAQYAKDRSKGMKDRGMISPGPKDRQNPTGGYVKIPDKYNNKNRSGLKVNLTGGKQTYNFDLVD